MKIKFLLPFLFLLIIFTFFLINSNSPKFEFVNKYPNTALDNTYYLLWKHNNDENTDTFLNKVKKVAIENNVNKIYTQELNFQSQLTTLFYFENGELISRISSDRSLEELEGFFNKSTNAIITEGEFEKLKYEDYIFVIKDIVLSNVVTNNKKYVDNINDNRFILSIKFYVYNNSENIHMDINDPLRDILKDNIEILDADNNNIEPDMVHSIMNTSNLYIGDRAKGVISFVLPIDKLTNMSIQMDKSQSVIPLSSVEFKKVLEYNLDF